MVGDRNVFGTLNNVFQESSTFRHELANVDQVCGKIDTLTVVVQGCNKNKPLCFKRTHVRGRHVDGREALTARRLRQ